MEILIKIINILLENISGIILIFSFVFKEKIRSYFTQQSNKKIASLENEFRVQIASLENEFRVQIESIKHSNIKRESLTDDQRICIDVVVLFFGSPMVNPNSNKSLTIDEKIKKYLKSSYPNELRICDSFRSPIVWLMNKIISSTTSLSVYKLSIFYTQCAYNKGVDLRTNTKLPENYELILFSILYSELVFDFKGLQIEDDFLLSYSLTDYFEYREDNLNLISQIRDLAGIAKQ